MGERVLRNRPDEVTGGLHILGECALVGERAAVEETCNMVADRRARDILTNLHDVSGEVAAHNRAGYTAVIHVWKECELVCAGDALESSLAYASNR